MAHRAGDYRQCKGTIKLILFKDDGNGGGEGVSADAVMFVNLDDGNGKTEYRETRSSEIKPLERKASVYSCTMTA